MPSIALGSSEPDAIRLGEQQVNRIYLGRQIVWPSFDTPSGPKGCWVPVFQTLEGAPPQGHPELCRDDLNLLGSVTQIAEDTDDDDDDYWGFDNAVHGSGHGIVPQPPAAVTGGNVFLSTLRANVFGGLNPSQFAIRFRQGNSASGPVVQLTDDFYNNGYIGIFGLVPGGFGADAGRLLVLKASYGTRSAATTLTFSEAQLLTNHREIEDAMLHSGIPVGPLITSRASSSPQLFRSVGFFTGIDALADLDGVEDYEVDGVEPYPALYYGAEWTTYGLGEAARFLVGRSGVTSSGDNVYNASQTDLNDIVLGSAEIADGLVVSRIRYDSGNRRMILNRTGSTSFNGWATGDGAAKSLFVAARGDIMELPFVATHEYEGDANPNTELGGSGFFRWDLRTTTPGAIAMHQHIVDFLAGDGYQLLFVVADRGTVQAVE